MLGLTLDLDFDLLFSSFVSNTANISFFKLVFTHFLAGNSMLSALYAIARPPVRLSVVRVDQSKTVELRIMQFSPYSSIIPQVFAG